MNKILEEVLASYKKASKAIRTKILNKYGYKTEAEFFAACGLEVQAKGTDMVVAFDTTGSMSEYISAVRKHIEILIPDMFTNIPNLKMKIVAFGDYCDMPFKDAFGKAYQQTEFTDNQEVLKGFVKAALNTGGGDGDEFYELVIKKVTEETPWRENTEKVFLLIGDADPHEVGYTFKDHVIKNQIDWRVEAKKAKNAGIKIDTLRIHKHRGFYKEISDITGGACVDFQSSEKSDKIMKMSGMAAGATYDLRSRGEFNTMYSSAVADGDDELVGAMKEMAKSRSIKLD